MRSTAAVIAIALCHVPPAHSQIKAQERVGVGVTPAARNVTHVTPADVARALRGISAEANGVIFDAPPDGHAQFLLNRRSQPSRVERHRDWDDIVIVRSGTGELRYGSIVDGDRAFGRGERRDGTIRRPAIAPLAVGDVVRVPAGVAHQVVPTSADALVYLVVKVRRGLP